MHIAFVAQPFDLMHPPVRGGSLSLWIYYMARLCAERQHTVTVFGNNGTAFGTGSTRHDGVNFIFTPTGLDRLINRIHRSSRARSNALRNGDSSLPLFASRWHHGGYAYEVARRVRRLKCDAVHVMNYSQFVPTIRRMNPNCKIGLHMQCEWLTQLASSVIKPRIKQADVIIGCSDYITHTIATRFPHIAAHCVTVPNAAQIVSRVEGAAGESKTVLYVGRLSPEKGVHDLLRAFHHVLLKHPDATLRLVGGAGSAPLEFLVGLSDDPYVQALRVFYPNKSNGSKDPYLHLLEAEAGTELGKRIVFEGHASHDQIQAHYGRAAVLVNASLSESFGISLVEAMMQGLPVVATRIGGMTYTVEHSRTGLLVNRADPLALAQALSSVLADPNWARMMGAAGRNRAIEMFSWGAAVNRLLTVYSQ
jgi:glycosyltransferase involved in cell wall biosynthesis